MANYELGLTAGEIDIALQKAHSPTTSITNTASSDPSLVTSGAVKAAIDNISVGSTLTVDSFATAALETASDGLTNTDDAIPTSAAVLSEITASPGHSRLSVNGNSSEGVYSRTSSGYISFGNSSFSIGQIVTLSSNGNTMSFPKGTYLVEANIGIDNVTYGTSWRYQLRHNGNTRMQSATVVSTYNNPHSQSFLCKIFVSSTSTQHVQLYAEELVNGGSLRTAATTYITVTRLYG